MFKPITEIDIARYVYNCEKLKDHYGYSIWSEPEHKTSVFLNLLADKANTESSKEMFSVLAHEVIYNKWVSDNSEASIEFSENKGVWTKEDLDAIQTCMDRYYSNKHGDYAKLIADIVGAIEDKSEDRLLILLVQDQRLTLQQYRDNLLKDRLGWKA